MYHTSQYIMMHHITAVAYIYSNSFMRYGSQSKIKCNILGNDSLISNDGQNAHDGPVLISVADMWIYNDVVSPKIP